MNTIPIEGTRSSLFPVVMSAVLISFAATLSAGATNILTVKFVITDGSFPAVKFALGCMLGEVCYAAVTLLMIDRIIQTKPLLTLLKWITLALLLSITIYSFKTAFNSPATISHEELSQAPLPFMALGFLLTIINPLKLPFWMEWTSSFLEKKVIDSSIHHFMSYMVGICLGSLLACTVFVFAGQYLAMGRMLSLKSLHLLLGSFFLLFTLLHFMKMVSGKIFRYRFSTTIDSLRGLSQLTNS